MAEFEDGLERLDDLVGELEGSVGAAQAMTGAFRDEMDRANASLKSASDGAKGLSRSLSGGLRTAFDDLIFDGARLSDALSDLGRRMLSSVLNQALKPVQDGIGNAIGGAISGAIGGMFAKGASFSSGRVRAFADGGIVSGPTTFPMRGGVGLMGEAGPEAIMPLARGPDGALGVRSQGGGGRPVQVVMNISTPDVEGFQRARGQVAAQLSRALSRGNKFL